MTLSLNDLALAYELRQEGCCWKRISVGLGFENHRALASRVSYIVRNGIAKGLDGYVRQSGKRADFHIRTIQKAQYLRSIGLAWAAVARELKVDADKIRKSHHYALKKGMIKKDLK